MLKELGLLRKALAFAVAGAYSFTHVLKEARKAVREGTADGYPYPVSPCRSGSVRLQGELWQSRRALLRIPSCLILKSKQRGH